MAMKLIDFLVSKVPGDRLAGHFRDEKACVKLRERWTQRDRDGERERGEEKRDRDEDRESNFLKASPPITLTIAIRFDEDKHSRHCTLLRPDRNGNHLLHTFWSLGFFCVTVLPFSPCGPKVITKLEEILKVVYVPRASGPGLVVAYITLACIPLDRIQTHGSKLIAKETIKFSLSVCPEGK